MVAKKKKKEQKVEVRKLNKQEILNKYPIITHKTITVFSPEECEMIVSGIKKNIQPNEELIYLAHGAKRDVKRIDGNCYVLPVKEMAVRWIYERITKALNSNEMKQAWGFETIDYNDIHMTEFGISPTQNWQSLVSLNQPLNRKLYFNVSLSERDSYTNGDIELWLNGEKVVIDDISVGQMIVIPSFIPFRMTSIRKGKRVSLCSWVNGNSWK